MFFSIKKLNVNKDFLPEVNLEVTLEVNIELFLELYFLQCFSIKDMFLFEVCKSNLEVLNNC